jgi:hypothetical protein
MSAFHSERARGRHDAAMAATFFSAFFVRLPQHASIIKQDVRQRQRKFAAWM